ncbi:hypothetical protein B9G98_00363 [Wickerhamiella sorbophila]|uniref:Protein byr4 n=1 Tax=Wickerhamiella sorbophila TaxID=45607 RepID=A0A2T0FCK6_9ASCO|nr:hypothetical protein B9G98_00363 [Wickerhamiella sorbophila]PRT52743.1 hypothetical protein B9G98_00363 [Wickerhamiella sorbophila]
MHKYIETDNDDDGFGTVDFKSSVLSQMSTPQRNRQLAQHTENFNDDFADDFNDLTLSKGDTIKRVPTAFSTSKNGTLKMLASFRQDPNRTLSGRPSEFESTPTLGDSDFEDGFDGLDDGVKLKMRFAPYCSDGYITDGDSPARMSMSSSASSISSLDNPIEEEDFVWEEKDSNTQDDLLSRFQARERRARLQDLRDFAAPSLSRAPATIRWAQHTSEEESDDIARGIDLNALDFSRGTINKNIIFGYKQQLEQQRNEMATHMADINRRLRSVQSIAQLPDLKSSRLRSAKSMMELPSTKASQRPQDPIVRRPELRPLTQYIEPERPVVPKKSRSKPDTSSKAGLHDRRRRKIGLIRNPATNGIPQQSELNGMIFNPAAGQWEGNEGDVQRFDNALAKKPTLISKESAAAVSKLKSINGGMCFDKKNLCWVQQGDDHEDPDPFAGIDELDVNGMPGTRDPSFGSSIGRGENAEQSTFEVSREMRIRWRKNDERFNRKFGRWIGRSDLDLSPAYDVYKMVYD